MLIPLSDATRTRCGGKAAALAELLSEGLPVPDGFVVPFDANPSPQADPPVSMSQSLREAISTELHRMDDPVVAVRSSSTHEDTAGTSAAGQYESILGVRGIDAVTEAIIACWESATTTRVADYRHHTEDGASLLAPEMAVLVQHMVPAEVSGVMFTPQQAADPTRIEASWGLGTSVVDGTITPDSYAVAPDNTVSCTVGNKQTRTDLGTQKPGIRTIAVTKGIRTAALDNDAVVSLATLGKRIAQLFSTPQDIEWAISGKQVWILQSRPITAELPATHVSDTNGSSVALTGMPGSHGVITANARLVHGPSDFSLVQPGEIIICPFTDPAWTPLFRIAAGVVTEIGGALSHAAIVAREYGIPAVLGVEQAMQCIDDGNRITLDGTAGAITVL